jgi:predicted nucleotidyltransferase component of viral defense system
MELEQLELKRAELKTFIDNFHLSSEAVVRKAREFEELANKVYAIKDGAYWMRRAKNLESLLCEVSAFCPAGFKHEINKALEFEQ